MLLPINVTRKRTAAIALCIFGLLQCFPGAKHVGTQENDFLFGMYKSSHPSLSMGDGNYTAWLELGGRGLDTAFDYGHQNPQKFKLLADAMTGLTALGMSRSDVFVTGKIRPSYGGIPDFFGRPIPSVEEQVRKELQGTRVAYFDLLLMHWPAPTFEQTLKTYFEMVKLKEQGIARELGVSNFNASLLQRLHSHTRNEMRPTVLQNYFSVGHHHGPMGDVAAQKCRELGVLYEAWSPLGGVGLQYESKPGPMDNPVVKNIAEAHGVSNAAIALSWVRQQGIAAVISSFSKLHIADNLQSIEVVLTNDEMSQLSAV